MEKHLIGEVEKTTTSFDPGLVDTNARNMPKVDCCKCGATQS
jgi:hypothetical protein